VNESERAALDAEILARLGDAFQLGTLEANSELLANLGLAQIFFNILGLLALLMGGFIIFNTFRTLVAERRRDIGMLRALGATRRNVMGIILAEGLVQGILGTGFGIVFGYLLAILMVKAVNPIMQQFLNIALPTPEITAVALFGSIAMGIGITLLAGLLPARQASKITPLEALRPQLGQVKFKQMTGFSFWSGVVLVVLAMAALLTRNSGLVAAGGVLFIVGLILAAPALVHPISNLFGSLLTLVFARGGIAQLAQGNITRQPSRSVITASTTLIGMAILIMAASMVTSLTGGFEKVIRKNLSSDFLLIPPSVALWGSDVGADRSMTEEISQIAGVEVVSSLRYAPSQLEETAISVMGIDPVTYPQVSGLDFSQGDEGESYMALNQGRSIIVNPVLAATFGVKVGDEIALMTPAGAQTYHVVAVGGDYLSAKIATGYVSQANLAVDFQHSDDVMVQINLASGADAQSVETELREVVKAYPQFRLVDGRGYIDEAMRLFDAAFAGMTLLVVFLSIPSLIAMINTLAIGVIERTQEIGMLRAVGTTRRQIQRMITAESLILAGLGTVMGILAGLYLGYLVVKSMQGFGLPMFFSLPTAGVLLALAGGILLGLVAAIIPARQAARMVIVEALRYE
jgi:putative ABC transport system permease protein